jgi:hypothetical protein
LAVPSFVVKVQAKTVCVRLEPMDGGALYRNFSPANVRPLALTKKESIHGQENRYQVPEEGTE